MFILFCRHSATAYRYRIPFSMEASAVIEGKVREGGEEDHLEASNQKKTEKKSRIKRKCCLCGKETDRMGQHLTRKHPQLDPKDHAAARMQMIESTPISRKEVTPSVRKCPKCGISVQRLDNHLSTQHAISRKSCNMKELMDTSTKTGLKEDKEILHQFFSHLKAKNGGDSKAGATAEVHCRIVKRYGDMLGGLGKLFLSESLAIDDGCSPAKKRKKEESSPSNPALSSDDEEEGIPEGIYLDYNATTPLDDAVVVTITTALTLGWGNPSSGYAQGQRGKFLVDRGRRQVAAMIGASPGDIIFTSGGTESNNLVIHTGVEYFKSRISTTSLSDDRPPKPHIVTSNLEHDSIRLPLENLIKRGIADVTFVAASTKTGRVEAGDVMDALRPNTCLVTIMHANNETGVIQPVGEIFKRIEKQRGATPPREGDPKWILPRILLHTDAAQTIGKIPVNAASLNADYLTIVGHKFYGPRIGALYVRGGAGENRDVPVYPMLFGGGQERNLRPGTENTCMIAGLGKACALVSNKLLQYESHMRAVRDYLEVALEETFPNRVHFNGRLAGSERIPNTCNVSILGKNLTGRKILSRVKYFQASVGSACHSKAGDRPSPILLAIGIPHDIASNALRLSVGRETTVRDIEEVVDDIRDAVDELEAKIVT